MAEPDSYSYALLADTNARAYATEHARHYPYVDPACPNCRATDVQHDHVHVRAADGAVPAAGTEARPGDGAAQRESGAAVKGTP